MPEDNLEFLLKSYRFLDTAARVPVANMPTGDREKILRERARTFRQLLTQRSKDPSVALIQMKALIECLATAPDDAELAALVADASRQHLAQIAAMLPRQVRPLIETGVTQCTPGDATWPNPEQLNRFDASTDRIVILDTNYRYRFANKANLAFHGKTAEAFFDQPLSAMTNEAFFERVTKPVFDRCFAGQATACVSHQPGRDPNEMYSGHFDPIRDAKGRVVGALVVVRYLGSVTSG